MRSDVTQALEEYEIKILGNRKKIEKAEVLLTSDEKVLFVTPTNLVITAANTRKKEKLPGVVFLTDQRIVFHYQIMFDTFTEGVALDEIRSINSSAGLMGGHIEIHTLTKSYDILVSYKPEMVRKLLQVFEKAKADFTEASESTQPAESGGAIEQIEKLAELNKKGILTDEEFAAKKAELLAKI